MTQSWEANSEKVLTKLVELADADKEIIKALVALQGSSDQLKGMIKIIGILFVVMTPIIMYFVMSAEGIQNDAIADQLKDTFQMEKRISIVENKWVDAKDHAEKDEGEITRVTKRLNKYSTELGQVKEDVDYIIQQQNK